MTTTRRAAVRVYVGGHGMFQPQLPDGVVYVGRAAPYLPGSPYANRHPVGKRCRACRVVHDRAAAVAASRQDIEQWTPDQHAQARADLAGRDLACWCRLDQSCHADVLLEVVNA